MYRSNATPAQKCVDPQLQTTGYNRKESTALAHEMAPDGAQIDSYPQKLHWVAPVWPMPEGLWIDVPSPAPVRSAAKN